MAKRFRKIYLEVTNRCNLQCTFCPGTRRPPAEMSPAFFAHLLDEVQPYTDYIYLHLMGEPLLHPALAELLAMAGRAKLRVNLTTNGLCIGARQALLLESPALRKVSVSLHAYEANRMGRTLEQYLGEICAFLTRAAEAGILCELRLWNADSAERAGKNSRNAEILAFLHERFGSGTPCRRPGCTELQKGIFLAEAEIFDWPDAEGEPDDGRHFCLGLRDQIGVLCDGTVVPCCLDSEGTIALGNLHDTPLAAILDSERARRIYDGFSARRAAEPLCARCGYARRFG